MPDSSQHACPTYLDFDLEIGSGQGREYPVAVLRSPAGEAREVMHFPFDELQLDSRLKDLQIALLRSGGRRRQILSSEEQAVQAFGRDLFNALFTAEVRIRYDVSQVKAAEQDRGLRVKLRITAPELAALPWEFLYDSRQADFVCMSRNTPLVRYLECPQPIQPLTVAPPLRILGMIASPSDLEALDVERERRRVEDALASLRRDGQVELTWLEGQTWRDLQRAMRGGPWHVFHFVGHGGFDANRDEGMIVLTDDDGRSRLLMARELARLLAVHRTLRLVVLNACEGARGGGLDIFSSTASILVRQGIPAVLAMQYEITDRAAVEFARGFYEAVADGLPVDAAVSEARQAVSLAVTNTVEWGTPVLHMRAPDGLLFDLATVAPAAHPPALPASPAQPTPAPAEASQTMPSEAGKKATSEPEVSPALSPRAVLRQAMNDRLSVEEIKTACFDLGIAYDELDTTTKGSLLIELIGRLERRERGGELIAWLRANRRDTNWPDPFPAAGRGADREAISSPALEQQAGGAAPGKRAVHSPAQAQSVQTSTGAPIPVTAKPARPMPPAIITLEKPIRMELVRIPAGEFLMGSDPQKDKDADDDEKPQHRVHLPDFYIGKAPVTNVQFEAFVRARGHKTTAEKEGSGGAWTGSKWEWVKGADWRHPGGPKTGIVQKADHPVVQVSWEDAVAFCTWLSETTGQAFRLPAEAEWEKAARGTSGRIYPWGDMTPDASRCNFNREVGDTTPVGKYPTGATPDFGVLDMAGNVWEWCNDWYDADYYTNAPEHNPPGPPTGQYRVLRGGSWYYAQRLVRAAVRSGYNPANWDRQYRLPLRPLIMILGSWFLVF